MKKTKKKRDNVQFPGLTKNVNSKVKQEYMDQDYIDQLTDEEKRYLSNFNEEYYGGNFNHPGRKLHRSDKNRKACYHRNNARNRCLYGLKKAGGLVMDQDTLTAEVENARVVVKDSCENALIEIIDRTTSDEE